MIFIVGNSRSGTTMIGRVFGRNSDVYTFDELHFFEHQVDSETIRNRPLWSHDRLESLLERLFTSSRDGFFSKITPNQYSAEIGEVLTTCDQLEPISVYSRFIEFEASYNGKSIACEQTPRYLFFLSDILIAFPNALVINVVRDPRDVLISQRNKWKRRFLGGNSIPFDEAFRSWANYHPLMTSMLWVSCIRQGQKFANDHRVKTVYFEALLKDPAKIIRNLADFTGISYEEDMLNVPQVGSSSNEDKPDMLGINSKRASGWRRGGLTKTELDMCEWVAGKEMISQGYGLAGDGKFSLRFIPSLVYVFIKLLFAIPLNLTRTKNTYESIRRRLFIKEGL